MDSKEKAEFRQLIQKAGNKVARTVTADVVDAYYDYLKDFPPDLIEKAINQAYHERDPDDVFLKTQMVTSIEIEQVATRIVEEASNAEHAKCPKCDGIAWIIEKRSDGRLVAHPCECLYNRASEALMGKSKTAQFRKNFRHWETIVKSYEIHQRR